MHTIRFSFLIQFLKFNWVNLISDKLESDFFNNYSVLIGLKDVDETVRPRGRFNHVELYGF